MPNFIGKFLDPGQVENIICRERQRRRKARLNQVRQLAQGNAATVCEAVRRERLRQTQMLSRRLEEEYRQTKTSLLEVVGQEYGQCLMEVGVAHKGVEIEKVILAEKSGRSIRDRLAALERGRLAQEAIRAERTSAEQEREQELQLRKNVRSVEDARAGTVASLPPPKSTLITAADEANAVKGSPTKSGNRTTGDRSVTIDVKVVALEEGQVDARLAAQVEEERQLEALRRMSSKKREQTKKERRRYALAKARMEYERDYNQVLLELEKLDEFEQHHPAERALSPELRSLDNEEAVATILLRNGEILDPDRRLKGTLIDVSSSSIPALPTESSSGDWTVQTSSSDSVVVPPVHLVLLAEPRQPAGHNRVESGSFGPSVSNGTLSGYTDTTDCTGSAGTKHTVTTSSSSVHTLLPDSTTSLDDEQSQVVLAGHMYGELSGDVDTVASPTPSMVFKAGEEQSVYDDGSWTDQDYPSDRTDGDVTLMSKKPSESSDVVGQDKSKTTEHDNLFPDLQVVESEISGRSGVQRILCATIHQPSTVPLAPEPMEPVAAFQNVKVMHPVQSTAQLAEGERLKLLRQLLLTATRNLFPSDLGPESGREVRGRALALPDLSTIVEVDTPDASRVTIDRHREDGHRPLDVLDASVIRRFGSFLDQAEKGISEEPNLTFVSSVQSALSANCSLMATSDNDDDAVQPHHGNEITNPFSAISSAGSWWLDSFRRMAEQRLETLETTDFAVAATSATLSYREIVTGTTTPSCPTSGTTTDLRGSTFEQKGALHSGSLTLPSSSSSTSASHSRRMPGTTAAFQHRRELNFSLSRVETVSTPTISTSGSGGSRLWSECLTDTPAEISPPAITDSESRTATTVLPRGRPRQTTSQSGHLSSGSGSYPSIGTISSNDLCPELSIAESSFSFQTRKGRSRLLPETRSETELTNSRSFSQVGGSRSFPCPLERSANDSTSESLLSFLLHEISAISALSTVTPLELSLSSPSQTTTSS